MTGGIPDVAYRGGADAAVPDLLLGHSGLGSVDELECALGRGLRHDADGSQCPARVLVDAIAGESLYGREYFHSGTLAVIREGDLGSPHAWWGAPPG